jgi:ankyrin repeat protein
MAQRLDRQDAQPKKIRERTRQVLASAAKSLRRALTGKKLDDALWYAARTGHDEEIRRLLKAGASITARGSNGMTAMQQAVWGWNTKTCALLIREYAKNGDVKKLLATKTKDGRTPLQNALRVEYTETARFLKAMEWIVDITGNEFMKSFAECVSS